jgi:hypothetical protein
MIRVLVVARFVTGARKQGERTRVELIPPERSPANAGQSIAIQTPNFRRKSHGLGLSGSAAFGNNDRLIAILERRFQIVGNIRVGLEIS